MKTSNKSVKANDKSRRTRKKSQLVPQNSLSEPNSKPQKPKKPRKKALPSTFSFSLFTCFTVGIDGFNQPKLLSTLGKAGVRVKNVQKSSQKRMTMRILAKDGKKTFAICEKLCYNYEVVSRDGLFAYFSGRLGRAGIVAGTLACAALTFFYGGTITRVEVSGLESISRSDFIETLAENGYGVGVRSEKIDRDEVRKFVNSLDGIAECGAEVKGNTLIVRVIERDRSSEIRGGKAVVATSDAVITRVVCKSGTPKFRTGEVVRKGSTLIEGTLYDGEGNPIAEIAADGEVYGTTVTAVTKIVSTAAYRFERTGKKSVKTSVGFGKFFTIGKSVSPFASFETETRENSLTAILPLRFTRTEFYETAKVENARSIEEIAEETRAIVESEFTKTATSITSTAHITEIAKDLYEIRVLVTAETLISTVEY